MLIFRPVFLLVEPSPTLRSSLNNWLADVLPGYQILAVSSGAEAIPLISLKDISQVLIEMYLPEMTCTELIREIRTVHPDAKITVTGWQESGALLKRLTSIGADSLIAKDKLHSELVPLNDVKVTRFINKLASRNPLTKIDTSPATINRLK